MTRALYLMFVWILIDHYSKLQRLRLVDPATLPGGRACSSTRCVVLLSLVINKKDTLTLGRALKNSKHQFSSKLKGFISAHKQVGSGAG